jgi:hypothetical protein
LFRADLNEDAEKFPDKGFPEPTEHYNVVIQKFTRKDGYQDWSNLHILLDDNRQPIYAFCKNRPKLAVDLTASESLQPDGPGYESP